MWKHIVAITEQKNDILFPSNIENNIIKEHFDSILDFFIEYLEHRNLQKVVHLNFEENTVRVDQPVAFLNMRE